MATKVQNMTPRDIAALFARELTAFAQYWTDLAERGTDEEIDTYLVDDLERFPNIIREEMARRGYVR